MRNWAGKRCERFWQAEGMVLNYRNGHSRKTVKTQLGEVEIRVPRDRNGSFEPKIIGRYERNVDGMEEKILSLYACGMSQRDISEQIKELYGVEISPELVTKISKKITPEVSTWQNRPLEKIYPFLYGCDPLQGQGRSPLCDESGLYRSGDHNGWNKGYFGNMGVRPIDGNLKNIHSSRICGRICLPLKTPRKK